MPKFEDFDTDDLAGGAGSGGTANQFPEGLVFNLFNDHARASLASLRRFAADTLMSEITTTGSGSAYTLTLTETLYTALPGVSDPHKYVIFNPHTDCLDDATLNVNALGAEQLLDPLTGANVKQGDLKQDRPVIVVRRPGVSGWLLAVPGRGTLDSLYALLAASNIFTANQQILTASALGQLSVGSDLDTGEAGRVRLTGENDADELIELLSLRGQVVTNTDGAEDTRADIYSLIAGVETRIARLEKGLALGAATADPGVDGGLAALEFYENAARFFPQRLPFAAATVSGTTATGYGIANVSGAGNAKTITLSQDQGSAANYAVVAMSNGANRSTTIESKTSNSFIVSADESDGGQSISLGTDWSVMCFKTTGTLE